MDQRRFNKNLSNDNLQKKVAENRRKASQGQEQVPDITDFMNDMFFGTVNNEKKVYNLTGNGGGDAMDEDDDFDMSTRSTSSRLTQEWLEEAKRLVASSPTRNSARGDSPSRLVGSPRFAVSGPRLSISSAQDKRDPLSRSARRNRSIDGISGEILTKSAKYSHSRNSSQTSVDQYPNSPPPTAADDSPALAVQKWFSNILKPPTAGDPTSISSPPRPGTTTPTPVDIIPPRTSTHRRSRFDNQSSPPLTQSPPTIATAAVSDPAAFVPPRSSIHRKSRFQNDPNAAQPQLIPTTKRTFKATPNAASPDTHVLSPPKHLHVSARRRSLSSSTCSVPEKQVLSPPRNLVESAQRRSISSSTCSTERILQKPDPINDELMGTELSELDLNGFLKEQRIKTLKLLDGEIKGKAKIVLSGHSNSTSSMVAAICYAWLLDTRMRMDKNGGKDMEVVVPVLNVRRGKMWKQRQAAWLFHHAGVDATAVLFADEVELETLMMNKQLNILVVGQEILRTNGEVGSECTVLTDNYCEDAYDLLQNPVLKKLLLAGILLDTHNMSAAMTKDTEAVRLLSVGSAPNYANIFYDQLTQEQRDPTLFEALRQNYGKPPNESKSKSKSPSEDRDAERRPQSQPKIVEQSSKKDYNQPQNARTDTVVPSRAKPKPTKQTPSPVKTVEAPREKGKNTFFLAKWFGFGR